MADLTCPSFFKAEVARFTRLDRCGKPVYNNDRNQYPCSQVTTDGFVTIKVSPEVDEGKAIEKQKANGKYCISQAPCATIKWYNVEITLCEVNPALIGILNPTWEPVCDANGQIVGFDGIGDLACDTGYALEIWVGTEAGDVCADAEAEGAMGYFILPWIQGGAIGDLEFGGEGLDFTLKGKTKRGSRWGRGPYNVQADKNGDPGRLLRPIGPKADFRQFVTTVLPPEPECDCTEVPPPPPEPAKLTVTRLSPDTVSVKVDTEGTGPVKIEWGDGTTTQARDGQTVTHTYKEGTTGDQKIAVTSVKDPNAKTERTIELPLTDDKPQVTFEPYKDPDDPDNPNCVRATVELPKHAVRSAEEAKSDNPCDVTAADKPDAWIDWGDRSGRTGVRVDPATGKGTATHCYTREGRKSVVVSRDAPSTIKVRPALKVPVEAGGGGTPAAPKA